MRTYTASEINELIEMLRSSGEMSAAELSGMDVLGRLVTYLQDKSYADIQREIRRHYHAV